MTHEPTTETPETATMAAPVMRSFGERLAAAHNALSHAERRELHAQQQQQQQSQI